MTSVSEAARAVLLTAEPAAKVAAAQRAARDWRLGRLDHRFDGAMPDRPARPDAPELLPPREMPRRGKGGSERGRIALIHALAHIEFVAIDLAFDMAGRFGGQFPRSFTDDWMKVGADEAMHFALLDRRLKQLGSHYGAMPAHDGLWEAAEATAHDAAARLAVVPMVLEARGLDVTPMTIERFEAVGDMPTAAILRRILNDEIVHVAAGTRWFESCCAAERINPENYWRTLLARHFRGSIKPPFNDSARETAGLTRGYYESLAVRGPTGSNQICQSGGAAPDV
ncbi:ferritin-like domain-containing protein [Sphingomonas suaedae]|uniref:Ferritin-like domain-containing protein n=1 Tax=Sphingomonas suaedae TaxID=2599297 RepID=A0A518REH8_9SPHN|nr:ferritin-like domain-containing protein [Sphingomonas suaedae]QDX25862.1 ferritin-like domain-containing protein [Sphingomonas suaedae]